MLTMPPSEISTVALVPAGILGDATCYVTYLYELQFTTALWIKTGWVVCTMTACWANF